MLWHRLPYKLLNEALDMCREDMMLPFVLCMGMEHHDVKGFLNTYSTINVAYSYDILKHVARYCLAMHFCQQ